jgi:hypothetical protein
VPVLRIVVVVAPVVAIAVAVGPGRLAGDVVRREPVGVGCEQGVDLLLGGWREIVLGNERDNFVPVVAPGERRACRKRERRQLI